ncbi:flagellar basal body P-ring formation chaperone FlgA [Hydrogenobacter sp. T-2]|uniref:flagellar basal body P-ring formation chaperone FlgA n=1 Tax=Pampinifervens diazotrophicum TaxID=1632018 RepID=UPI002B261B8C|nr:flagellar basal body P-ring formation chaperone FlgA [Hydrogenobacter sp. T-2]WPM31401.1 flagellar basal body P-ring formation chaperone FlgA [Hydrogenobacter sp. T-2]
MWLLSLLLLFSFAFSSPEELIESEVYRRFGDSVKVQSVRLFAPKNLEVERIELDMEYGRSRAVAYLYSGKERYQAVINALWKVKVFIALEDIPQGSPIHPEQFRTEERFMKTIPSDLRLSPEDFEKYMASTRITKGTMLRRSLLKEVLAVKGGDLVEVVYRSGFLEVSFYAVAVDSGTVGKIIRIRREDKMLRGRVVSRGKVEALP